MKSATTHPRRIRSGRADVPGVSEQVRRAMTVRSGLGADAVAAALIDNLHYRQATLPQHATRND